MDPKQDKIPVHIVNGNAFIWNPEDLITLRIKYRIVGSLVGLLPKNPLQNIFSSLPLILLPEEVTLLLEKEYIYLINDKKAHHKPSSTEIKDFNDEQEKLRQKDNSNFLKQKNAHIQKNMNKINNNNNTTTTTNNNNNNNNNNNSTITNINSNNNGIINNTQNVSNTSNNINNSNNSNINNVASSSNNSNINNSINNSSNNNAQQTQQNKTKKKNNEPEKTQLIHIQTNSKNLPWYKPSDNNNENECFTLEEAKLKNLWNYPNTPNEIQKYKVFCDIWEKPEKYFITSGSKYGSDYLIYPGDPVQYHSNFLATVIYDTDFEFSPEYIIRYGRLGTNVKKTHLLCNIDKRTQKINYYSIEWSSWI
ncbi:hypothetical protein BCR32DRAFT_219652 [Anaeromyces robustus]|uniref:tRNA-splicing endonuclease subunit Sen34 n=1 Tax=Anaeromyces robustus TaxID=1754192 RepID=A0A1Y1X8Y6_9FUNG|nr:hypothetical protein BCR32DRAFT_219652 [Anaeromyces robustus]|eukprot:ORX82197.1 hypothetical protein BCR32DRAFT_219652 [Anaeromyces robustus]